MPPRSSCYYCDKKVTLKDIKNGYCPYCDEIISCSECGKLFTDANIYKEGCELCIKCLDNSSDSYSDSESDSDFNSDSDSYSD